MPGESAVWCDRHWRPYRERQGNGILASVLALEALMSDERFVRACGYDAEAGTKADGSSERLNAEIAKLAPICCFLGDEVMADILARSGL